MNPYDEEPSYRSRPRSSRSDREDDYPSERGSSSYDSRDYGRGSDRDSYGRDGYGRSGADRDVYTEPPTRNVSGRASVGRASASPSDGTSASVGRASVGRASVSGSAPAEPVYGAPYGEASRSAGYGDASYGQPYGSSNDPYIPTPTSPGGVPTSPARGTGRAQVRPVSPSGPPTGGGGYGPGGPGGRRPFGFGRDGDDGGDPDRDGEGGPPRRRMPWDRRPGRSKLDKNSPKAKAARKRRIRNIIIASVASVVMLTGIGFVAGTYFVDTVQLGDQLKMPQTTTLYYNDGVTVLAKLGEFQRTEVPFDNITPDVIEAIVASEDNSFWTNEGVDFGGVMRAAWNNVTGGDQQGGSTITQQYARRAFALSGASYNRKLREAVLAWKMSDKLSKEEIITSYLNTASFGRRAIGIEAAAKVYFNKSVKKDAPDAQRLNISEAMALVLMVKQPEPDPDDPEGAPGYDPKRGETAKNNAVLRWEYVRDQMVKMNKEGRDLDRGYKYLTQAEADKLAYPPDTDWLDLPDADTSEDLAKPVGLVKNHVLDELSHTEASPFFGKTWQYIEDGGYSIVTTLDARAQLAAEQAADENIPGSVMADQRKTMQAALVAVEPGTGRVIAYYGGHSGTGNDYAGMYYDQDGVASGYGRHPPGSTFKVYTLAAALNAGYSLNSYWWWLPHEQPGRAQGNLVTNASDCTSDLDNTQPRNRGQNHTSSGYPAKTQLCSLLEATTQSLNVPFYEVTSYVGANKVLEMARDAGIQYMWSNKPDVGRVDLRNADIDSVVDDFGIELGIGQFGITVADHANGVATFANGGKRADEHFVREVKAPDGRRIWQESLRNQDEAPLIGSAQVADLTYAMSQVCQTSECKAGIEGFDIATKTGTWELNQTHPDDNGHAWNVGFTTKLAAAVWVGNKDKEEALELPNGNPVYGSSLPRSIWLRFMKAATQQMGLASANDKKFGPPAYAGDENPPGSTPSPVPTVTESTEPSPEPSLEPSKSPSPGGSASPKPSGSASPSGSGSAH